MRQMKLEDVNLTLGILPISDIQISKTVMSNDTFGYLHCQNEDYSLLYVTITIMATSSMIIASLMSYVVWMAKRQKQVMQTPQRLWIRPLDLLMGDQVGISCFYH